MPPLRSGGLHKLAVSFTRKTVFGFLYLKQCVPVCEGGFHVRFKPCSAAFVPTCVFLGVGIHADVSICGCGRLFSQLGVWAFMPTSVSVGVGIRKMPVFVSERERETEW